MRLTIFFTLIAILTSNIREKSACELPEQIEVLLAESGSKLKLVKQNELIEDWYNFLPDTPCPTLVQGDFNGDTKMDYCALMHSDPLEIVIFEAEAESYKMIPFQKIDFGIYTNGIQLGMQLVDENNISGISESIKLKYQGIIFYKFETSSFVIYYENGVYKKIWAGD